MNYIHYQNLILTSLNPIHNMTMEIFVFVSLWSYHWIFNCPRIPSKDWSLISHIISSIIIRAVINIITIPFLIMLISSQMFVSLFIKLTNIYLLIHFTYTSIRISLLITLKKWDYVTFYIKLLTSLVPSVSIFKQKFQNFQVILSENWTEF